MTKLNNLDLLNNKFKYDINILEKNIQHLNKKFLISTQKLTARFCIMYLFDTDIESGNENSYLFDVNYILEKQPHIIEEDLYREINEKINKK
jgi:hypothetical protein